ncbi:uncharacterized protein LOC128504265 [Spea bombifrons]|uniref:uncharacterized protein LOC128504265 n=1 Tax=Spea bombifrons TaxID=233779 RepID=UPI00234AD7FE|nr:uncharacterized protein LOC128504265 [Spea bombifrons]
MHKESESSGDEQDDPEDIGLRERILSRRHKSLWDITSSSFATAAHPPLNLLSASAPDLSHRQEANFRLSADFRTSMKELEMLKDQLLKAAAPLVTPDVALETTHSQVTKTLATENILKISLPDESQKHASFLGFGCTPKPVMKYVHSHKKKAKKKKRILDPAKLQIVLQQLNQPPGRLERSVSLVRLPANDRQNRGLALRPRSGSLPKQLDFTTFLKTHGAVLSANEEREWVREIWNEWFDEVFPPSRASVEEAEVQFNVNVKDLDERGGMKEVLMNLAQHSVPPLLREDPTVTVKDLETEISHLTLLIEEQAKPSVFHCCRRGALNRKLGNLSLALQDLDLVIKEEPQLLDAYWHRHLIYLAQGKSSEALDDLNTILKYNKSFADAYLSKAEIFKQRKDFTMSILNYSQALKYRPTDDDVYFRRAQMYEAQDDILIAMDDYAKCFHHNPNRTDAIMKRGSYYFENGNWTSAAQDFTALIQQDIHNVQARIYRGRAHTQLAHHSGAVEDFSAAIHLDPKNWLAFYYRGCLLRKRYPYQALQDFSISVLLNNTFENLKAFLHRGILYTDLGLWAEAAFDFECVLALDRTIALAHVNLGLISLQHQNRDPQAIRHFSAALTVNPIYVRAYLCRAQAFQKIGDLQSALRDITRAIHLCPDSPQLYILRGQYLCEMRRYDLASFCIHHAAQMTEGLSPVQQALVQSFLRQHSSAIKCLVSAVKDKPDPVLMTLLGKTEMKAKKYKDATESFRQALDIFSSSASETSASEKAEVCYLLGLCHMEQFHFLQAIDALTGAVKARPDYCDAYHQRGLCRMRLQQVKCVQDFNRALQINPNHFQAYLSRAAFYGIRKRYSKAIMNCNAAIKVQPSSVRAYLYRGALKYHIKAYKLAVQDLSEAAELDPSCSLAYYNRGVCYHQTKRFDEALKDYGIALLLGGWKEIEIKVLVNRGLLYLQLHDHSNALEDFKAVAMKTPEDVKIQHIIGNCYHRLQQYEEAVQAFNQLLKLNPLSPAGHIARGNAYMEYGHKNATERAQRDFIKALHLNPGSTAARICLGYNLQALGFHQRAWNQFTVALDIDAHSMLGFEGRSIVNLQMGDTFAALQDMNAALKLGVTAQLLTNRGVIHQFMGKLPNAMKDYQSAITADPDYSLAYFNAANLYLHNRQFSQAREYYSQAIQRDPGNESAFLNRGITNMLLQNFQGALDDFQRVLDICPVSSSAYFNRATLYNALQRYQQAEDDITQALTLQPGDPLMYKLRADIRGKIGLQQEAIKDYEQAVTLLQGDDLSDQLK